MLNRLADARGSAPALHETPLGQAIRAGAVDVVVSPRFRPTRSCRSSPRPRPCCGGAAETPMGPAWWAATGSTSSPGPCL